ncbi:MAG: hypothetical protein QW304_07255 [Thermoproteota archaeon]
MTAAVFVYYPITMTGSWVDPPVRFQDPSTSGVSVTLSNDNTTAVVDATTSRDLVLDDRNAFIYDDFNTNPFTTGRVTVLGGTYNDQVRYVTGANPYVRFRRPSDGSYNLDHVLVYYQNNPTPVGARRIFLLAKSTRTSSANGLWKGFFLFNSVSSELYYTYEFWDSSPGMTIVIVRPDAAGRLVTGGITDGGVQYIQWGVRDKVSGYMEHRIYSGTSLLSTISTTNNEFANTPSYVGFGGALEANERFNFDDFVACADADPRFVNVTGLDLGWAVYLEDSGGAVLASATAGPDGVASLNVITTPIVRNGYLRVMQGSTTIVPSKFFDVIVGGDVYRCISVLTDRNLLAYRNFDTKSYNVYLKLDSYSITGYVYSLNLWVSSGTGTTPIQFVNNINVTDTTSTISLGSGATNYIHGNATLTRSSTVVLTLSFHYYIPSSEVEVEYPVTVTIHG